MGFPFCLGGRVADKISIAQKRWVEHGEDKNYSSNKSWYDDLAGRALEQLGIENDLIPLQTRQTHERTGYKLHTPTLRLYFSFLALAFFEGRAQYLQKNPVKLAD